MRRLAVLCATVFYSGLAPAAPGTVGSAAGLVMLAVVRLTESGVAELALVSGVLALGVWSSTVAEVHYDVHDPPPVVIDEVAGMLITLLFIPVGWIGWLLGFLVFRACDIVKPFPANRAERLPRGWGVMADDVVAGMYAHAGVRLIRWAAPTLMG